jgi:hypothetical protein
MDSRLTGVGALCVFIYMGNPLPQQEEKEKQTKEKNLSLDCSPTALSLVKRKEKCK